jgi:hypothetical protein
MSEKLALPKVVLLLGMVLIVLMLVVRYHVDRAYTIAAGDKASTSHRTMLGHSFEKYDILKAQTNTTYPVCGRLSKLLDDLMEDEADLGAREKEYSARVEDEELHCGNERVYGNALIFGKKHFTPWTGCPKEIIPGKRRLFHYLQDLCAVQERRNLYHHHEQQRSKDSSKPDTATASGFGTAGARSYGVVMTGKTSHFKNMYQAIVALRKPVYTAAGATEASASGWNARINVEVWVDIRDVGACARIFEEGATGEVLRNSGKSRSAVGSSAVACRALPKGVSGFASKFHALLGTDFTDALFLDSDNIISRDVSEIFNSRAYEQTGSVLWPDLWGNQCMIDRGAFNRGSYGYTAYRHHVLFQAKLGGLEWKNERPYAHESEAGQIALNLRRHGGLLHLGKSMIEDTRFLKRIFNGDKDIFRIVHLMTGEPFTFVHHLPGYSTTSTDYSSRDCLSHYFGRQDDPTTGEGAYSVDKGVWRGWNGKALLGPVGTAGGTTAGTAASTVSGRELTLSPSSHTPLSPDQYVHLAVSSDAPQLPGMKALIRSAYINSKTPERIVFHIFQQGGEGAPPPLDLSAVQSWLPSQGIPSSALQVHDFSRQDVDVYINEHYIGDATDAKRKENDLRSPENYARFILADRLPNVKRVAYLDTDIVLQGDIVPFLSELAFKGSLGDYQDKPVTLAAFPRDADKIGDKVRKVLRENGMDPPPGLPGFNAGILLIDLEKWRRDGDTERMQKLCRLNSKYKLWTKLGSQSPWLASFGGDRFQQLDGALMVGEMGRNPKDHPGEKKVSASALFLHWSGSHKPWARGGRYMKYWTPYSDAVAAAVVSSSSSSGSSSGGTTRRRLAADTAESESESESTMEKPRGRDFWFRFGSFLGGIFTQAMGSHPHDPEKNGSLSTVQAQIHHTDINAEKLVRDKLQSHDASQRRATIAQNEGFAAVVAANEGSGSGLPTVLCGDGTNIPMFYHQLKQRDSNAFGHTYRVKIEWRDRSTECMELGPGVTRPLVLEDVARLGLLTSFAAVVFDTTDNVWSARWADSMLWRHDVYCFIADTVAVLLDQGIVPILLIIVVWLVFSSKKASRRYSLLSGGGATYNKEKSDSSSSDSGSGSSSGNRKRADSVRPEPVAIGEALEGDSSNTSTLRSTEIFTALRNNSPQNASWRV